MHSDVLDKANVEIAATSGREIRRYNLSVGLVCSVLLHGLLLPAFILMLYSTAQPRDVLLAIPVDVVELSDETTGPPQPEKTLVPQQRAAEPSLPVAEPVGISRLTKPPLPDALETKLRMLAKLQQPVVDTHLLEKEVGRSRISAMRDEALPGPYATYALSDLLRAQIERRWGPDLARLGGRNLSILIRVEMTSRGVVTKAEIVKNPQFSADKAYDDIALSARNAVLLCSPFTLPPGHYEDVMNMTLSLNTRDALR
jgi:hypothetical protein